MEARSDDEHENLQQKRYTISRGRGGRYIGYYSVVERQNVA